MFNKRGQRATTPRYLIHLQRESAALADRMQDARRCPECRAAHRHRMRLPHCNPELPCLAATLRYG